MFQNIPVYIYIHVCCINNWKERLNDHLFKIKDSGLYDIVDEIRLSILGEYDENLELFNDNKVKIVAQDKDVTLYETFTLNKILEDCFKENFLFLYVHTKGLHYKHQHQNPLMYDNISLWIDYMCFFNMYKYRDCLHYLYDENYDAVGVNLSKEPTLHYSGNFWWSKSSFIRNQEKCIHYNYNSPEFWVTTKSSGKYKCLWHSNVNMYNVPYYPKYYNM